MQLLIRSLLLAALGYVGWMLWRETEFVAAGAEKSADPSLLLLCFFGLALLAGLIGAIIAAALIPQLGEGLGRALFFGSAAVDSDPHRAAAALLAQGDFKRALRRYEKLRKRNPDDTLAIAACARLYRQEFHDPARAAAVLEQALAQEQPVEAGATLALELADLYARDFRDATRARAILEQIIATLPDTKHAAHAQDRLRALAAALGSPGLL